MKSAFERAMERFGGDEIRSYTDEQKEQLAEVDRVYDAKTAQAKFSAQARLSEAGGDAEKSEQVREDLRVELASIEGQREKKKKALRAEFGKES